MMRLTANEIITPHPAAHRGGAQTKNNTHIIAKWPPYGKALADRQRLNQKPLLVVVCTGRDCWNRAKHWQTPGMAGMVLPTEQKPSALQWPVKDCPCLIEWGSGTDEQTVIELVSCLLRAGAALVAVMPMWVDHGADCQYFDPASQNWIRTRESMRTYYPRKEVRNAAR